MERRTRRGSLLLIVVLALACLAGRGPGGDYDEGCGCDCNGCESGSSSGGCGGCNGCAGEEKTSKPGGYLPPPVPSLPPSKLRSEGKSEPPPALPQPDRGSTPASPEWKVVKVVKVRRGWFVTAYTRKRKYKRQGVRLEPTIRCNGWGWPLQSDQITVKPGDRLKLCAWK